MQPTAVYEFFSKIIGNKGSVVLNKKQFLKEIAKIDKSTAKAIEESVNGISCPTFELSNKIEDMYKRIGLKIKFKEVDIADGFFYLEKDGLAEGNLVLPNKTTCVLGIVDKKSRQLQYSIVGTNNGYRKLFDADSGKVLDITERQGDKLIKNGESMRAYNGKWIPEKEWLERVKADEAIENVRRAADRYTLSKKDPLVRLESYIKELLRFFD